MGENSFFDEILFDDDFDEPPDDDAEADLAQINAPDAPKHATIDPDRLRALEESQRVIDQFNANPLAAVQQILSQMGMEARPRGNNPIEQTPQTPQRTDIQQIEDLIEDPSMRFLAPIISKVAGQIADRKIKEAVEPLRQSQTEIHTRNRQQEYVAAAQELASRIPDWQTREPDMQARLDFLRSAMNGGPLTHHKYGNVLEMLHQWASGNNRAVRDVAERYRQAPTQRGATSGGDQATEPDILKMISKAATPRDQFRIAFDTAVKKVMG